MALDLVGRFLVGQVHHAALEDRILYINFINSIVNIQKRYSILGEKRKRIPMKNMYWERTRSLDSYAKTPGEDSDKMQIH